MTVAELMSTKPKPYKHGKEPKTIPAPRMTFAGRDGLGAYTADPDAFDRVIYHNDKAVIIIDMYPKSSVHLLVLPKSSRNLLHPFNAFQDPQLLADTKVEVERAKQFVINELRRKFGQFSKSEQPRIQARDSDDPPNSLPDGRDWSEEIITGIHAGPSMNHLHVHVMSREMVSPWLKRNNHYNSFHTPFLVPLEKFPLARDDPTWSYANEGLLGVDMVCWRCGQNFRNKMSKFKVHLDEELEEWKRE